MYVGLATANGDFSAGAAAFEVNGNVLTAKTKALNKKYGQDKSDYEIQFVAEVYDIEAVSYTHLQLLDRRRKLYNYNQKGVSGKL